MTPPPPAPPRPRPWLVSWFRWYAAGYLRKHFHAVRLAKGGSPVPPASEPVLVVLNHPSWWDPLIATLLSTRFRGCEHYAAIDPAALAKYRMFSRLGFVGVDGSSFRGAAGFLRTGRAILAEPGRVFWVTAQGRFTDVRTRPLALQPGVGHLAARIDGGVVLPVALEYTFWTERTPEALVRVGPPLRVADHAGLTGKAWSALIEDALTATLDALNADAASRDPGRFETLVSGRTGVGGVYDGWRRLAAWARGRRFDPSHGGGGAA